LTDLATSQYCDHRAGMTRSSSHSLATGSDYQICVQDIEWAPVRGCASVNVSAGEILVDDVAPFHAGQPVTVTWACAGPERVKVTLCKGGPCHYSGGSADPYWLTDLATSQYCDHRASFTWSATQTLATGSDYQICVQDVSAQSVRGCTAVLIGVTASSTVTTSSTTTTLACPAGEFPSGGSCWQCADGMHSDAGSQRCLPLLSYTISTIQAPELQSTSSDYGVVRIEAMVSELPTEIYGGSSLWYSVDMAPSWEQLERHTPCGALWSTSHTRIVSALLYDQLSGPCRLAPNVSEDAITLHGVLGIFLLSTSNGNESLVNQWWKAVSFSFDRAALAMYEPTFVSGPTLAGAHTEIFVGPFGSSLLMYPTSAFGTPLDPLVNVILGGDLVFLEHVLQPAADNLSLIAEMLWLSRSANPEDPAEYNLTESMYVLGRTVGAARFSVKVEECKQCYYLHAASRVYVQGSEGRRLARSMHVLGKLFVNVIDADTNSELGVGTEVNVDLLVPPWLAIICAAAAAIAIGKTIQLLLKNAEGSSTWSPCNFLVIEAIDAIFDTIAYYFCKGAGDLAFANDELGLIDKVILTSTIVSVLLFGFELSAWCCSSHFRKWVPLLVTVHIMFEDFFQFALYSLVAASQAQEGIEGKEALVILAGVQAFLFAFMKLRDILGYSLMVHPRG